MESPGERRDFARGHDDDDDIGLVALSPDAMARRARLRRIVGGIVAFVGVLALAVVGKTVASSGRSSSSSSATTTTATPATTAPKLEAKPAVTATPPAPPAPAPAPAPAPSETAEAKPAESAAADAKPPEEAKPAEGAMSPEAAAALEKETLALLNRGKNKDAITKAREAIAADPTRALPYLYLGSALQDSGKWKEGIEAYSECVRKATQGPVNECRQMGGRK